MRERLRTFESGLDVKGSDIGQVRLSANTAGRDVAGLLWQFIACDSCMGCVCVAVWAVLLRVLALTRPWARRESTLGKIG